MMLENKCQTPEHDIVLEYTTPGLLAGSILTIIGVIYIIFLAVLHKKCCEK